MLDALHRLHGNKINDLEAPGLKINSRATEMASNVSLSLLAPVRM